MHRPALLGTVLAGGLSTRMGRCKAELPHACGGTFLDHAIEQLSGCCDQVACSLAVNSAVLSSSLPPGIYAISDRSAERGPVEGVRRAIGLAVSLDCAAVLVTPVDLPALKTEHLEQLVLAFYHSPGRAIVAVSDDDTAVKRVQPLVAIYPVSMEDDFEALAHSAYRGVYRFVQSVDSLPIELPAAVLHNVNSPEDLLP